MMFYFDKSGEMKEEQTRQTYIHVGTYHMCVCHPLCTGWYCVSCFLLWLTMWLSAIIRCHKINKGTKNLTSFLFLLSTYSVGRAGWQGWLDQRLEQAGVECGEVGQHVDRMAAQRFEGFQWHLRNNIRGGPFDKGRWFNDNQNCISFLGYLGQSSGWRDLHFAGHAPRCSLEREGGRGWTNHGVLGSPTLDKGET